MSETITNDYITIGGEKIFTKTCELNQADLKFYPENPRVYSALNSDGSVPSQEDIEEHMMQLDHVRDLRDDIAKNGGLMEAIIVRDGDFVVLEGNSRLAAYRLLCQIDAVKWAKIKCNVLPADISEHLIFKLIGQFHLKGKKPWDAYEQASYLYRRHQQTKTPIAIIAQELNIIPSQAQKMIDAVELMKLHSESDNHKYSYYFEYVKDGGIKKFRDTDPDLDATVISAIKSGEIERAEDMRLLGKVAKVGDKQSKRLMKQVSAGNISIYQAHATLDDEGKLESSVTKLKAFKKYVNNDSFEKNVRSGEKVFKEAKFEIEQIKKRLERLLKKWEKEDE